MANELIVACTMVEINMFIYYKVKYAPSLKKIEWVVRKPSGLVLLKILNTFTSSIGECHAGNFSTLFSPLTSALLEYASSLPKF